MCSLPRLTGKSIRNIQRHVATGKLSMTCHDDDKKGIDTSELIRVYSEISDLVTYDKKHDMSRYDTTFIEQFHVLYAFQTLFHVIGYAT
jgi:hypothetical protein